MQKLQIVFYLSQIVSSIVNKKSYILILLKKIISILLWRVEYFRDFKS